MCPGNSLTKRHSPNLQLLLEYYVSLPTRPKKHRPADLTATMLQQMEADQQPSSLSRVLLSQQTEVLL